LDDMRPVFNLDIPFPFAGETDVSHLFRTQEGGVTFVGRILKRMLR
jgi:hypothetical protein